MKLTVYGDFNCPLSYAASARVDLIHERGLASVEWRAVEHDPSIPAAGRRVEAQLAAAMQRETVVIQSRLRPTESLPLRLPPFQPNTAAATVAYADATPDMSDAVRRRLFRAIWVSGLNLNNAYDVARVTGVAAGTPTERVAHWRRCWLGLERPVVPILLLHTGYVARGFVALACLGRLAFTGTLPYRPWGEFRREILDSSRREDLGRPVTESTMG